MLLREKLEIIPKSPGCYLFKDSKGQIIYVGKSKYLPNRVMSYFRANPEEEKIIALQKNIVDVDFVTTINESEAILLEDDLIKLYKPKFNIKGKDDRGRKWGIWFTEGEFPKLEVGPVKLSQNPILCEFTSSNTAYEVYESIHRILNLRTCSYNLTKENIENKKFKSCLEYQIKKCDAPCEGLIDKFTYKQNCENVRLILSFEYEKIEKKLKKLMYGLSNNLEFEKCEIVSHKIEEFKKLKGLLESSRVQKVIELTKKIKNLLNLKNTPLIVESFDNSHNQGDGQVSASVRFVNGIPEKSSYRKYNLRSVKGPDDYASFEEVIFRRLKRLLDEKDILPSLVLIDGGKGQLGVAKKVLTELNLIDKIDLISISKDENHRSSVIHTSDGNEFDMKQGEEYFYLGKIQEEVHRFTINFHRKKMSKKLLN
jgi:excinuclease ABC subunit C